jgi:hypothetical protein
VPDYRIYKMTKDNHIISVEEATFPTDHDALARAIALTDERHSAEVWDSTRLVAKVAARFSVSHGAAAADTGVPAGSRNMLLG